MSCRNPTELIRYLKLEFCEQCLTGPKLTANVKEKIAFVFIPKQRSLT